MDKAHLSMLQYNRRSTADESGTSDKLQQLSKLKKNWEVYLLQVVPTGASAVCSREYSSQEGAAGQFVGLAQSFERHLPEDDSQAVYLVWDRKE